MKNSDKLLLKTFLLSTSMMNVLKYSRDKKRKKRAIGNYIGMTVFFLVLMGYCIAMCIGYADIGMGEAIPPICAMTVSAMAFFFTFLKAGSYLFEFREYDMIMSLPFEVRTVVGSKFWYMYLKSLPWYLSISLAMMIGYGIAVHPSVWVYPVWLVLSGFLPLIPMVAATFCSYLITRIGAGFRYKKLVQVLLTFAFVIVVFLLRFILEAVFRDGREQETLESISAAVETAGRWYWPIGWFTGAVRDLRISDMLIIPGASILLFELCLWIISSSYRKINSALKSHVASKSYHMTRLKTSGKVRAIAFKEFKRFTGSTSYLVNAGLGEVLAVILGIGALIVGFDRLVSMITQGAPIPEGVLFPAIPLIVYFCVGMVSTTTCSPSLEGKNYWIVQSLPITKQELYQGKMLFNMWLMVPPMIFAILCFAISVKMPLLSTALSVICGFALCCFSTTWGCVCGVKHIKLEFENDVEVVKQGFAVVIYMLPNMFITMILVVLSVILGVYWNPDLVILAITLLAAILSVLSYLRVMKVDKRV